MSVSAATSVSHLPIEWAGAVVSDGDAQAFGLAINDAGKALDQGLSATSPVLGAPSLGSTFDALKSGFQAPARVIAPSRADVANLPASGMPKIDVSQEAPNLAQASAQLQKSIEGMRLPRIDSAAPLLAGQTLEEQVQLLSKVSPGLLSGAGLSAASENNQQADQNFQAPVLYSLVS
jgi:hypothetical protein